MMRFLPAIGGGLLLGAGALVVSEYGYGERLSSDLLDQMNAVAIGQSFDSSQFDLGLRVVLMV